VRHVLTHTAGLPYMPMGLGYKQLVDWDVMCSALANERPVHPPGEKKIYHAITYGWLLGEVARRVDGRPVPQQLQEEICAPLGITNMFIGLPRGLEDRVAVLDEIFDPGAIITRDDTQPQDTPNWMLPLHAMMNRLDVQRACLPAANGIMNARSLARHWAALLPGGVDGVELLPEAFVREAATIQEVPPTADTSLQGDPFALAYGIGGKNNQEFGSRTSAFGAGGYVGSTGFADPEYRLAASICKNLRSSNNAQVTIYRALRDALGIPH
jgi:CubicO group peptidase (beta-lactamase class C family)